MQYWFLNRIVQRVVFCTDFRLLRSYLEDRRISKVFADLPSPLYSKDRRPVLCAMDMERLCNVSLPTDTPVVPIDSFDKCPKWFSDSKRPPSRDDLALLVNQLRHLSVSLGTNTLFMKHRQNYKQYMCVYRKI